MSRRAAWLGVLLLLAAGACSKPKTPGATTSMAALDLAPIVPANAVMISAADFGPGWFDDVAALAGLSAEESGALHADLAHYLMKTLGLDISKLHRVTAFMTADHEAALAFSDVGGEWRLPDTEEMKFVHDGDYLVGGTPGGIAAALAVLHGKAPGLAKDAPLALLFASESRGMFYAGAVEGSALASEPIYTALVAQYGVQRFFIGLGGRGAKAVAQGDGAKLATLGKLIEERLAQMAQALDTRRQQILDGATPQNGPDLEAIGAILSAHGARHAAAKIKPIADKESLRVELDTGATHGALALAGIGIGAAIAVPAFMKYMRQARTSEATFGVQRLYDAVLAYHAQHQKLPAAIAATPEAGACCHEADGECRAGSVDWKAWEALDFSIDGPIRYSYALDVDATSFTARALGDLDCDGTFSTFEMAGRVLPDGTLQGSEGIYKNQELE